MDGGLIVFKGGGAGWIRRTTRSHAVILAAPVSSFPPKAGLTNKWSEAGIQLKYASGVAGHNRRLRRRNNAASKRLCHATRDDISIAGSPPTGEDDGVGVFCKNGGVRGRRNNKQPSFSPLMFVISAEGGGDEQLSKAGIQDKYASGVAGHNRRLRRRNNAASKRLCHATRDDISIAGSPPAGEDDGVGGFCKNGGVRGRRNNKQPSFSPLLPVMPAKGGNDEQLSEAEKIAGSDFSRAKRARRARIRDDTRKSS